MEKLSKLFKNSDHVDIEELILLNNQIKSPILEKFTKKDVNVKTSFVWYESGIYLKKLGNYRSAEVCFFMSHIYNKTDTNALKEFILSLAKNDKYKMCIELLPNLHSICVMNDISIFWDTLTTIIPKEFLISEIKNEDKYNLDLLTKKLCLDNSNPMTWLCIGYSLKLSGFPILSSQALDNSLALKSLQLKMDEISSN